ncbi:MAG TPA: alpha/beta fold hydrolase [Alphaproteobacteria bacterium]|jgi:3-oxoadipate enol-lactonase|nr:alpha/beta fold hydrolase [Alphaproteobacteria bacterium]HJM49859.1 alpha/beta fold hydrolase [Alphaproteobacteria bacterium]|tara:strand:+ start:188 stop:1000 length:813 start_codon:yes stop_codon:yes gene_type:complete
MASIVTERLFADPAIAIDRAGEGEFLIFLHGIGGNRSNWTEQVEAFSRDFHTAAWDARGYGASDDYDGPLDFSDFARDLGRVLDHFDVDKGHIVGLSMGGRIAQDFFALFPERVKTLTLVATHSSFQDFTPEERQRFIDLRRKPLVEEGKQPADIAPLVARSLLGPFATEAQYRRLVASIAALHKESYIKTVEVTTMFDRSQELGSIDVPTLLVYGENDPLTQPEKGRRMADRIPGAEFVVIPRAGHLINLEQPELFDATVREFLLKHGQ